MRRRLFTPGRFHRASGRNHVTKPRLEALELRRLLSGDGTAALAQAYGQLPLSFQVNEGQTDPQVSFLSQGEGYALFLTPTEAVLSLQAPPSAPTPTLAAPGAAANQAAADSVLSMQLAGASAAPRVVGLDELPGTSSYLLGNDPSQWHTGVPSYAQVEEKSVYPGVDLVYYGNQQQLEYNFTVAPGADPGVIRMTFTGAQSATLDDQGNLVLQTAGGAVVEQAPVLYQEAGGVRQPVPGQYVLEGNGQVGFAVGQYDPSQPLVIDPVLSYSTFLGGSSSVGDAGDGIAVDAAGNAYVVGYAASPNFPTANALQGTPGGSGAINAFVAELNAAGTALVYSTYLGGSGRDIGRGIAVDSAGDAYVAGLTNSTDFPTAHPLQAALQGADSAFVAKLNPAGTALVYSTYLGGSTTGDAGYAIAVDSAGDAYVTGQTSSPNFPTANAVQAKYGGGYSNAFVSELNPAGTALVYSTYLGGSGPDPGGGYSDVGFGIAVDSAGNAYVTGQTDSLDFPIVNALQPLLGGPNATRNLVTISNAFVTKFSPGGTGLVYSTYLGGSSVDVGTGIALDSAGNVYVTGWTVSQNFPTVNALQDFMLKSSFGDAYAFVSKLNSAGTALVYSTYLGGSNYDLANGIAVDSAGDAYVIGFTESTDFPTVNPLQATLKGSQNAFVTEFNPTGTALLFSTYLGGSSADEGEGIAVDSTGNAYVTGFAQSADFPTVNPLQAKFGGGASNAFVAKIGTSTLTSSTTFVSSKAPNPMFYGGSVNFIAIVASNPPGSSLPGGTVQFQVDGTNFGTPVALVGGSATSGPITTLSAGPHTIQVLYSGTSGLAPSTGTYIQKVSPAPLTITAQSASKNYGQTITFSATAFTTSGLVGGDMVGGVTEASTGSPVAAAAGTYPIVPDAATFSAGLSSNYAITYVNGTLTVNPVGLAVAVASTVNPSVYGQSLTFTATVAASPGAATPTGTVQFQIDGTDFGPAVTLVGGMASSGTIDRLPAGARSIQALYSGDGNDDPNSGTLIQTVTPATLTITAQDASKTYGQTATFGVAAFTTSGLVGGDMVGGVTETSTGSPATAAAGTYPIVPDAATFSAGLSSNYAITYANGTLTVNPAALTITANDVSKTYGQTATFGATAFTASGLVGGDTVGGVTYTSPGSEVTAAVGTDPIAPVATTFSAGLSSNYAITYVTGTLRVNPAALLITANDVSKSYGQTVGFGVISFTTSGLVAGDTVAGVTETSTGSPATAAVGTYPIVPSSATFSAGVSGNYAITYANGTLTVNPAALTIRANDASKTYGQTVSFGATAFTTSGLVPGDTVGGVTETSPGSAATATAGTDPIVPSSATFSAGLSSNYAITYANGTLTVNPASPTPTPTPTPAPTPTPTPAPTPTPTPAPTPTPTPTPTPPQVIGGLAVSQSRKATIYTIGFTTPLNPAAANNPGLYRVLGAVIKVFKKRKETLYTKALAIKSVVYNPGPDTETITLTKRYKGKVQVAIQPGLQAADGTSTSRVIVVP